MLVLLLVLHFAVAATLVYGVNRLALIPWRKAQASHWTERARVLWPARSGNVLLLIAIPVSLAGAQAFFFPAIPVTYLWTAFTGVLGATLGTWPVACALRPDLRWPRWLRDVGAGFVIRLLTFGVLIAAAALMPSHFGPATIVIAAAVVAFKLWLIFGGLLWLLRAIGTLEAAPPRLVEIVGQVAARMALPVPRVWLFRSYGANAIAYPAIRTLVVTEGTMDALDDEELAAVCAHEFAHLNEPKSAVLVLVLSSFVSTPLIFLKPAMVSGGPLGILAIGVSLILFSRLTKDFRRRLEKRADSTATVHEGPSPGTYARALEHLYETNLVPAVIAGKLTHPNLYDRLLAAGVTPAYPRPAAPRQYTWQYVVAILLIMASIFAGVDQVERERHKHWRETHPRRTYDG